MVVEVATGVDVGGGAALGDREDCGEVAAGGGAEVSGGDVTGRRIDGIEGACIFSEAGRGERRRTGWRAEV